MNFLIDPMKNSKNFMEILKDIKDKKTVEICGLSENQTGHIVYSISQIISKKSIIIAEDNIKARKIYEDLVNIGGLGIALYPSREIFLYDRDSRSLENTKIRTQAMNLLADLKCNILITNLEAIRDRVSLVKDFKDNILKIKYEDQINIKEVEKKLIQMGYKRYSQVEGIGQFAIRGGIIDIYSPNEPYRIELFDTSVDSIRVFDEISQRSIKNLQEIQIGPINDIFILEEDKKEICKNLKKELKNNKESKYIDRLEGKFFKYLECLDENLYINNIDLLIPFFSKNRLSYIIDYFDEPPMVFIENSVNCLELTKKLELEQKENIIDMISFGEALSSHTEIQISTREILEKISSLKPINLNPLDKVNEYFKIDSKFKLNSKSIINYRGKMSLFIEDIKSYIYKGYKIILMAGSEEKAYRLKETLESFQIEARYQENFDAEIKSSELIISPAMIHAGFEIKENKLVIINYSEIFGVKKSKKIKRNKRTVKFEDLKVGDYVVHESHGIGKYIGTKRLEVQKVKKDYIVIEYRGDDKLFIPIENLDLIYKYMGSEGKSPKINKLNSIEWKKTKSKAKNNVEDMAEDLIRLYAKRKEVKGYSFSKDTQWQKEFEDSFEYEQTDGQYQSSEEIKADMEKSIPMDRLLCADVGYGKTEVAIRAAFKAIMDGKQVAFLVPTTILAQQHYNTIKNRFKNYPIQIALLCRFRTAKEQKKDLEALKKGLADIVIGTHRLFSNDVKFKDLGLLIIDEEQRFGVRHKEKLKLIKENVDTLTLTATPIPRTLQMSMIGIRDMSVIEDPPEKRFPVQTYVLEYNKMMVREAILKEIERNGQVYFVYNKVANMENKLAELKNLVPEASFKMAHGQMSERVLEDTMISFINHEFDVLLCSTIIETGMDIQNANTIILVDANRFGLSQLYQLRGRIGRSNKIAYAYLTYDKNLVLSEVAEKRLKAIKEFTEFGSGYKLAMRDLEIRGSGSILGSRQHGHINSIGYDLYMKYLKIAVAKLKGQEIEEENETEVLIDIKIDSYIPKEYIEDENNRIEIYKRIATIQTEEDYLDLIDELIDRYSDIPKEVSSLMDISYINYMARQAKVKSIIQNKEQIKINLVDMPKLETIKQMQKSFKNISFDLSKEPAIIMQDLKYPLEDIKKLINILKLHKISTLKINN